MLRQMLFLLMYFGLLPAIVISPFAGVLIYKWLEYLPPGDVYYVTLLPDKLSFAIAAITILMWALREKKSLPRAPLAFSLLILFFIWTNFTSLFALMPDPFKWERTAKVIGFSIIAAQMMSTRHRIEAFVWVQVLCIAFSAIPGALKTISWGGGGEMIVGIAGTFINDRVPFAVVLPMMIPLTLFLAKHTTLLPRTRWLVLALRGIILAFAVALVGTYARTALFSGGTALMLLVVKARNKIWAVLAALALVVILFQMAPQTWFQRMDTTVTYQKDASAEDRIAAWRWSWNMAVEHPVTGGGFGVALLNKTKGGAGYIEAHNILFEVVSEHGFVGLALFCALLAASYRSCGTVRRIAAADPELAWARDLAGMIQISLLVFLAGGMFVSIATAPFLYDMASLAIGVRSIVEYERRRAPAAAPRAVIDGAAPVGLAGP